MSKSIFLNKFSNFISILNYNKIKLILPAALCFCILLFISIRLEIGLSTEIIFLGVECIGVLFLSALLKNFYLKIFALICILCHVAEVSHVFNTGGFVLPLTIMNFDRYEEIGIGNVVILSIVALIYVLCMMFYLLKNSLIKMSSNLVRYILIFVLFSCEMCFGSTTKLISVSNEAYKQSHFALPSDGKVFLRENIAHGNITQKVLKNWQGNVIIIFIEGTSKLVLSDNLTPNLMNFEKKSLSFINYYNHTAATYRGIRGQLISGYQYIGGCMKGNSGIYETDKSKMRSLFNTKVESLPLILNQNGYQSVFVTPHSYQDNFTSFLKNIGFQKVVATDQSILSDEDTYNLIFSTATNLNKSSKRFFLGAYTVGTHEGFDSNSFKYGDGTNPYYNKFYNSDHWFGEFLKKFENSDLNDNTLLIFTADHSSIQSAPFKKSFSNPEGSINRFIDKVPLFIYCKGIEPEKIDVAGRNSLGLTPTVLDILGIHNVQNHFLGNSLFSNEALPYEYVSAIGNYICDVKDNILIPQNPDNGTSVMIKEYFGYGG